MQVQHCKTILLDEFGVETYLQDSKMLPRHPHEVHICYINKRAASQENIGLHIPCASNYRTQKVLQHITVVYFINEL